MNATRNLFLYILHAIITKFYINMLCYTIVDWGCLWWDFRRLKKEDHKTFYCTFFMLQRNFERAHKYNKRNRERLNSRIVKLICLPFKLSFRWMVDSLLMELWRWLWNEEMILLSLNESSLNLNLLHFIGYNVSRMNNISLVNCFSTAFLRHHHKAFKIFTSKKTALLNIMQ